MTAIINWIKANWVIVALCSLMVVSLPTIYIIAGYWNSAVSAPMKARTKDLNEIKKVTYTTVEIQPLLPGMTAIKKEVTLNDRILEQYEKVRTQIKQDADAILQETIAINSDGKYVLLEGLFPEPAEQLKNDLPYRIHDEYISAHEQLLKKLNAGMPELPDDLSNQLDEYRTTYMRTQMNLEPNTASLSTDEEEQLKEAMTRRRMAIYSQTASEYSVFANLDVFNLDPWKEDIPPQERIRFDWQHEFWVNSDIVAAINRANTNSDGERTTLVGSPSSIVKQIISINMHELAPNINMVSTGLKDQDEDPFANQYENMGFSEGGVISGEISNMGKGGRRVVDPKKNTKKDKPKATFDDPTKVFVDEFSDSISGRISNSLYDIRIVDLQLIVDSERIMQIIDAFNSTNFMTVTGMNIETVNTYNDLQSGFYYGTDAVVQLDMTVETIWLRDWTTQYMSDSVKKWLGVPVDEEKDK